MVTRLIGWRDTDVDGIIDVLDRPLTLTGATGWWDPALRRYTFSATSAVQALANLNPNSHSSPASAISLNEVDYLQYRVDGAAWVNVNSTPYAAFSQTFTNVQINLPNPFSTLELRTYSADSRATSAVFTANTGPVPPSQFSFSAANYSGAEGSGQATITVVRQNNTSGPATVDYATSNGTATAGQDYTTTAGTLNFADGQSSLTFQVPIINDTLAEGDETVGLALSNPTGPGAVLGAQSTATLTVVDNDVNFRFSSASYSASEGAGQALITITPGGRYLIISHHMRPRRWTTGRTALEHRIHSACIITPCPSATGTPAPPAPSSRPARNNGPASARARCSPGVARARRRRGRPGY